jgi:NAD(P)-dependent dehydrogenase (short-subunit alcohol dehydrogenase family)
MGRASVEVFAREGACVVASDVSGREQETAASVGSSVVPFHCDVTREIDIEALVATAVKTFGRLDAMLNVACIVTSQLTEDLTQERYDATMDVNVRGVMFGMKHAIRAMLANDGGVILNWSSTGGLGGTSHAGVYVAAKHAIIGATKTAAIEYGPKGIRVNAICPGAIKTRASARTRSVWPTRLPCSGSGNRTRSLKSRHSSRPTVHRSSPVRRSSSTADGQPNSRDESRLEHS